MTEEHGRAYLEGLALGGLGGAVMAALVATIVHTMPDDPLKPVLNPEAKVIPNKLAADIAKDPQLQERWKAMREFVQSLDQQIGKNLEQAAGGSQESAKHWKDKASVSEKQTPRDKPHSRIL
jgi:hypothetical protein